MINSIGATRLELFPEYPYAKLHRMKRDVELRDNCTVLDLSIGSPTFPPLKEYIDKLGEYIQHDKSHLYPSSGAIPELQHALRSWYKKRFNVSLEDNELYPLIGAKDGVSHIPLALFNKGDEILIPDPGYPGFTGPALMVGAKPAYYSLPTEGNSLLAEIEKKVTQKTKAMWVNSPGNPTGYMCSKEELAELVIFAKKRNIIIIFDNAYSEITFNGVKAPSILEIPGAIDIAVELGSFSKSFSFAGFRMAWVVGNSSIIEVLAKVKSQMDSGLMHPLQLLGAYALDNSNAEWRVKMLKFYRQNRDKLALAFKSIGLEVVIPNGALYLWITIPESFKNGMEYTKYLLNTHHILVTPGQVFGKSGERCIRVSFSSNLSSLSDYFPFKHI